MGLSQPSMLSGSLTPPTAPTQPSLPTAPHLAAGMADSFAASRGPQLQTASKVLNVASTQLGLPYVFGSADPRGGSTAGGSFDCSGLTMWAYQRAYGVSLPHNAGQQYSATQRVSADQLRPGNLVFFNYGSGRNGGLPDHVALYMGNGQMLEASNGVEVAPVDWSHFVSGGVVGGVPTRPIRPQRPSRPQRPQQR